MSKLKKSAHLHFCTNQSDALICCLVDIDAQLICHKADNAENSETSVYTGQRVADNNDDCVSVHHQKDVRKGKNKKLKKNLPNGVVVKWIVAGKSDHATHGNRQRVEDLRASVGPDVDGAQLVETRFNVVDDAA